MAKRCAIVGTARTWKETPFDDPSLSIWTLNDAFSLGFPRIDMQFEQHPLGSFVFRDPKNRTPVTPDQLPPGRYLRPAGYVEWLRQQSQTIPVLLQEEPSGPGWGPHAKRYPLEHICEKYREFLQVDPEWDKPYASSGPLWMLLYALDQGYDEIGVYGIHLATEREYIDQRPNFEAALSYAIGKGVKVTLPPGVPIMKSTEVYCYEPRLVQAQDSVRFRLSKIDTKRGRIKEKLMSRPWWRPTGTWRERLIQLDAERSDLVQQLNRLQFEAALQRPEYQVQLRG